jgi:hypothetical protein
MRFHKREDLKMRGFTRRTIPLRATVVAAALLLAFGQQASAAVPNIVREYSVPVIGQIADCRAFQITGSWTVNIRDVTYFDASGTPVRDDFQAHFKGTIANSLTGKSIDDSGALHNVTDLTTGTLQGTGVTRHDTAPHIGLLLSDAGNYYFDADGNLISMDGNPHTDTTAICAYLGS